MLELIIYLFRLNFSKSYELRAHMALLNTYLKNWIDIVMDKLEIESSYHYRAYLKVIINYKFFFKSLPLIILFFSKRNCQKNWMKEINTNILLYTRPRELSASPKNTFKRKVQNTPTKKRREKSYQSHA